jgi:hypothetical protein
VGPVPDLSGDLFRLIPSTGLEAQMKLTFVPLLALAALPLAAHHSFNSMYSDDKPVTLVGVVTKVEWVNPHAHFNLDVKDASGKVTNWTLELAAPNALIRGGVFTRASLKEGDQVTVQGFRGKDDSNIAATTSVILADGRVLKSNPYWGMAAKQ